MKISTIEMLCCPFDKQDLDLNIITQEEDNILEGYFVCSHCKRVYPIVKGVPIMSPDEYREFSLEQPMIEKWGVIVNEKFQIKSDIKHTPNPLISDSN